MSGYVSLVSAIFVLLAPVVLTAGCILVLSYVSFRSSPLTLISPTTATCTLKNLFPFFSVMFCILLNTTTGSGNVPDAAFTLCNNIL